jgi:hypothetical protein
MYIVVITNNIENTFYEYHSNVFDSISDSSFTIFYLSAIAEEYRGFVLFLLREIWQPAGLCKGPFVLKNVAVEDNTWNAAGWAKKNIRVMLQRNGLYFLFLAYDGQNSLSKIYPLYVGITGVSFKHRFSMHIQKHSGVVYKIRQRIWPRPPLVAFPPRIVAYLVDIPRHVAAFYESLFLSLFDFAMNREENGGIRDQLQINKRPKTVKDGYTYFLERYNKLKAILEKPFSLAQRGKRKNIQILYNFNN